MIARFQATRLTARLAAGVFMATALLAPMAHAADSKDVVAQADKAKEYVEDAAITTKIKADFAKEKDVSATKIKVETDHGKVKLSGWAQSKAEADKAASIAKSTKGVVSVSNEIQVGAASTKY